jgi:general stress protein 26
VGDIIQESRATSSHYTRATSSESADEGVDTPNIVLIKVKANRITYWDGEEEGEVQV